MSVLAVLAEAPSANSVVAGWGAFWIFVGGCVAVALLGWSLVRQLRKAQAAEDAGVYGHDDDDRRTPASRSGSAGPAAGQPDSDPDAG